MLTHSLRTSARVLAACIPACAALLVLASTPISGLAQGNLAPVRDGARPSDQSFATEITLTLSSTGEAWVEPPEALAYRAAQDRMQAALRAFDAARNAGPEAVLAFAGNASDEVRAVIAPDVDEARAALAGLSAAEGSSPAPAPQAVPRVGIDGVSCVYGTIQAAIAATPNGGTVRIMGGEIFTESIDIAAGKVLTLEGGYDATCSAPVAGSRSRVASGAGSTIDVNASIVSLRNLTITMGTGFGAGVDLYGANSSATLSNTLVTNNHGTQGGGIYVSYGNRVTLTGGSLVSGNSAALYGGGVAVYGRLDALDTYSDISENTASLDGGGAYVSAGTLNLVGAHMGANVAAGAAGRGGAIYVYGGVVTLTSGVYIGVSSSCCNAAYDGAGIYANNSRISASGSNLYILENHAAHHGGGVYLTGGSRFGAGGGTTVGSSVSATGGNTATLGAGIYAEGSTVDFAGSIVNNVASDSGGGIYATASVVNLTGATVGGLQTNQGNRVGPAGRDGAGLYLITGTVATLSNTVVAGNALQNAAAGYGAGLYLDASSAVTLANSVVAGNLAPPVTDGRGAGIYARNSQVRLDHSQVLSNTGGAGGGVYLSGSTLTAGGSVFRANEAAEHGGAVYAGDSLLSIDQTYLHRNQASRGGAIYQIGDAARSYISNTLIYSNTTTTSYGAGIRAESGAITITHGTLANNVGGAGFSRLVANSYVYDSIIWGNSVGGSAVFAVALCNIDQAGNAGPASNPFFVGAGAGEDYRVFPSSPAVDACDTGLPVDITSRARPFGVRYDMGAYEIPVVRVYLPVLLRQ